MSAANAAVAAMNHQRKRLIKHFLEHGALTAQTAISEASLPHAGFHILPKLREQGVVLANESGLLYLDRVRWEQVSAARRKRAGIAILVVIIAALTFLGMTYFQLKS